MNVARRRWIAVLVGCVLVVSLGTGVLAAPAGQSTPTVQVVNNSTLGPILANSQGMTLYTLSSEAGGSIQCTGACLQAWPPLLLPSGTTSPTAPAGLTGTLGVITRPDGSMQVTYNGFPLYTFSGDAKAGDTNGEGIAMPPGTWHAAKVTAAAGPTATASTPAPTATSGTTTGPLTAAFPPHAVTNAKLGTILVDANGRTLYYLTSEAGAHVVCTGGCLNVWPPLLMPAGSSPPTVAGFPGTFGTVTRPDGSVQVTYNSLPLYIFAKDNAPGDTNGEGIKAFGGVWHATTPNLVPLAATPGARLTVRITTTGGTVWGTVTVRYQNGGQTVVRTCGAATCRFAVPAGAIVRFRQSPANASTWPFHGWQIKSGGRVRTVMKAAPALTIRANSTVTARYVLA